MRPRKVEPVLTRIPRGQHGVQWEWLPLAGGVTCRVEDAVDTIEVLADDVVVVEVSVPASTTGADRPLGASTPEVEASGG